MEKAMLYPDDWGDPVPLNTVLRENKARNESLAFGKEDVLSVSGEQGVVNQIQLLGRSYAGESVAPYHIVETGDLVYTKSPLKENPYGIIKQNRGKPGIVSTLYAVYHCDNPITGQYLENYFSVDTFLNNYLKPIVKRGAKNDMKVNNEDVLLGRVPLPSVEEQRRINEVLSKTDYLIHQKLEIIENLRRMKTICLIKMFPRKGATVPELRFPGFTAPWEQRKLGDIGSVAMCRRIFKHQTSESGDIPFFKIGTFGGEPDAFISRELFEDFKAKYPYPDKGDILISASGSIGRTVEFTGENEYFQDSNIVWLKHDKSIINPFLRHLYSVVEWAGIEGSTIKRLYNDNILKTEVMLPSVNEQTKIAEMLDGIDSLITLHQRELEEEQRKKKALMQLLLTGLARVNA